MALLITQEQIDRICKNYGESVNRFISKLQKEVIENCIKSNGEKAMGFYTIDYSKDEGWIEDTMDCILTTKLNVLDHKVTEHKYRGWIYKSEIEDSGFGLYRSHKAKRIGSSNPWQELLVSDTHGDRPFTAKEWRDFIDSYFPENVKQVSPKVYRNLTRCPQ